MTKIFSTELKREKLEQVQYVNLNKTKKITNKK